ncbi:MAG TPA: methyltransferase, TIGR04325 family [Candidatus Acidoferrum sp.]|nr:methyltransferase, TIGR04325 family [Candidatus Acidoferrum sp.]
MSHRSLLLRFRIFQIRALASLLKFLGTRSAGRTFITRLCSNRVTRVPLEICLGFRRAFPSFAAAQACAAKYIQAGHEHSDDTRFHTSMADSVRESDYPVLFHLAPFVSELGRVFDFGGNVGNLFYSYQRKLNFPSKLLWTVYDLSVKKALGEKLAAQRGETRIRFANALAEASGSDVFIASGSLHYFEEPLHEILACLEDLPKHVFVNRTPCSSGPDLITVQDNRSYLVPCKLHSRTTLIAGMQALGYELQSEWPVYERRLPVPTHPDLSARTYSGFYFRKK